MLVRNQNGNVRVFNLVEMTPPRRRQQVPRRRPQQVPRRRRQQVPQHDERVRRRRNNLGQGATTRRANIERERQESLQNIAMQEHLTREQRMARQRRARRRDEQRVENAIVVNQPRIILQRINQADVDRANYRKFTNTQTTRRN